MRIRLPALLGAIACLCSSPALANPPAEPAAESSAPASAAPPAASAPASPPAKKPFAEITRGASSQGDLLPLWSKGDQSFLQIRPDLLGAPLRPCAEVSTAAGSAGLAGHLPAGCLSVSFELTGKGSLRLVAQVSRAEGGDPERDRAVAASYPRSQLSSAPVLNAGFSAAGSESALVDANAFLLSDWPALASAFERALKAPYGFDPRSSQILWTEQSPRSALFSLELHMALPKLPAAGAKTAFADSRSALSRVLLRLERLPEAPMAPRAADARAGFFLEEREVLADTASRDGIVRNIRRWRLEKADPSLPLSPPKKHLIFWIDPSVPKAYRGSVREGILSWNEAFREIGFLDPIVAVDAPSDSRRWLLDAQAVVRWYSAADDLHAFAPSMGDERTGEMVSAMISVSDIFTRSARSRFLEHSRSSPPSDDPDACSFASEAAAEMESADALLSSDPVAREAFALAYLRAIVAHEAGHALGLRHNFKGSAAYSLAEIADPAFARERGVSSSVMDYLPTPLLPDGTPDPDGFMRAPGPYDRFAIAFGYSQFPPESEASLLEALLSRAESDPLLSFATDADAGDAPDPDVLRFDLSSDPLAFYSERMDQARLLWSRLERGHLPNADARRALASSVHFLEYLAPILSKSLSGIRQERLSAKSSAPALRPVSRLEQERALSLFSRLADPAMFSVSPALLARAALDPLERGAVAYYDLPERALQAQAAPLRLAFSPSFARRLLLLESLPSSAPAPMGYLETHSRLLSIVWGRERLLASPLPAASRALQREHALLLASAVSSPSSALPADAQASLAFLSRRLLGRLRESSQLAASSRSSPEADAHLAHLDNCSEILRRALAAEMPRAAN